MDAISCVAPPAALLSSFADAALHLFDSSASSSSSSATNNHHYSSPLLPCADQLAYNVTSDAVLVAARSSLPGGGGKRRLAPAGARAGKRRSRASKRAPTTYISTDPANFRLMVQRITGVQAEPTGSLDPTAAASLVLAADTTNPGGLLLMTDHQQQPCFPTLDSWNVSMYERNDLL